MNWKFTLALGILVIALAQQSYSQKRWDPLLDLFKTVSDGSVPPAVQCIDTTDISLINGTKVVTIGGTFDSAYVLNANGSVNYKLPNLKNVLKKENGVWKNGGDASIYFGTTSDQATLWFHSRIQGENYLSGESLNPGDVFRKLNNAINVYESIPGLTYQGYPRSFYDWGGGKILFQNLDGASPLLINGQQFRGTAIWNKQTNTLEHTFSSYGQGGVYGILKYTNDTLFVYNEFVDSLFAIKKSTSNWVGISSLDAHRAFAMEIVNGKKYLLIGTTSLRYELHRLDGSTWTKLLDLEPYNYLGGNHPFAGLVYHKGTFYIAGAFVKADGKATPDGIIAYDEATDFVSIPAATPQAIAGAINPGALIQKLYSSGEELYLAVKTGTVDQLKAQTVFVLKDVDNTPPPVPSIAGPTGLSNQTVLADSGIAESNSTVEYYFNNTKADEIQTDASGKWRKAFMNLPVGTYQRYVKARDGSGNVSGMSQTLSVTIDLTAPAQATLATPVHNAVVQRNQVVTFSAVGIETGAKVVFHITGTGSTRLSYADTVTPVGGTATLARSFDVPNTYEWTVIVVDGAGNSSTTPPQRMFTVSAITGIVMNPDDPGVEIKLFPNPVPNTAYVTNVASIQSLFTRSGQQMPLPRVTGKYPSLQIDVSHLSPGVYILTGMTPQKKLVAIKFVKR